MANCVDCVHAEVCEEYGEVFSLIKGGKCSLFKDHSRFVELPCKVGERLYVLFPKGRAIVEYVVIAFWIEETGTIIRAVDTRFFTTTIFFIKDIGTKAFLTKKEAEQALKEREGQ